MNRNYLQSIRTHFPAFCFGQISSDRLMHLYIPLQQKSTVYKAIYVLQKKAVMAFANASLKKRKMYTYKKNLKGKGDPIFIYIS
jgi:hypothetical protein